jgi:hypothetical protein
VNDVRGHQRVAGGQRMRRKRGIEVVDARAAVFAFGPGNGDFGRRSRRQALDDRRRLPHSAETTLASRTHRRGCTNRRALALWLLCPRLDLPSAVFYCAASGWRWCSRPRSCRSRSSLNRLRSFASSTPIYLQPDSSRIPLRTAIEGTTLRVLQSQGDWLQVEFNDPQ